MGALWTVVGTSSFSLSEMEPQENTEQGRDVPGSGVHRHPLLHVGIEGDGGHRKQDAAMIQASTEEGGRDKGIGAGRSWLLRDRFVSTIFWRIGGRVQSHTEDAWGPKDFLGESLSMEMI